MLILTLAFILAFCSFSYEVLLAFMASDMTGLSVLSKAITFGSFIFGLGVGGWRAQAVLSRLESDFISLLFAVQWRLVLLVTLGTGAALLWQAWLLGSSWQGLHLWALVGVQPLALGVGYLSGFELPVLIAWGASHRGRKNQSLRENQILVPHYAGVLVASVLVLSFMLPRFDMMGVFLIVLCLNLGVLVLLGGWLVFCLFFQPTPLQEKSDLQRIKAQSSKAAAMETLFGRHKWGGGYKSACVSLLTIALACFCVVGYFYASPVLYKFYVQQVHHKVLWHGGVKSLKSTWAVLKSMPEVERQRSPYQYIDVLQSQLLNNKHQQHVTKAFEDVNFKVPVIFSLFLNRQSQFSSVLEHTYHQQITHVPIEYFNAVFERDLASTKPLSSTKDLNSVKNFPSTKDLLPVKILVPAKALVLGAGDGLLVRELLKYKNMQIDLVELDAQVLKLAQNDARFVWQNKGSLLNPRVQVYVQDAISFLRHKIRQQNKKSYDAVFIDFPYPENYDLSKLYSVEFYQLVARVLNPEGFIVLDAPLDFEAVESRQNSILLSTLYYAGFQHQVPYGVRGGFVMARFEGARPVVQKKITSPWVSDFLKQNLHFRADVVQATRIDKAFVNSMFKPQPIGLMRRWVSRN